MDERQLSLQATNESRRAALLRQRFSDYEYTMSTNLESSNHTPRTVADGRCPPSEDSQYGQFEFVRRDYAWD